MQSLRHSLLLLLHCINYLRSQVANLTRKGELLNREDAAYARESASLRHQIAVNRREIC